jgi:hypothetical protein
VVPRLLNRSVQLVASRSRCLGLHCAAVEELRWHSIIGIDHELFDAPEAPEPDAMLRGRSIVCTDGKILDLTAGCSTDYTNSSDVQHFSDHGPGLPSPADGPRPCLSLHQVQTVSTRLKKMLYLHANEFDHIHPGFMCRR